MNRPAARALLVGALTWTLVSCAGQQAESPSPTEPLPLQKSGLVVGGDVEANATKVREFPTTEAQLKSMAEACQDAQGIPLEGTDPCLQVVEGPPVPPTCGPFDICVEIFAVDSAGFAAAGYVEVTDRRDTGSQCESDPEAVCLRVGVTAQAFEGLTAATGTPATDTPAPTETTATATGTPSPTESTPTASETGSPLTETTTPTGIATTSPPSEPTVSATP
jgi:hypothetical protein